MAQKPYSQELKDLRKLLGLTQAAMAARLGVRGDSLWRYENGTRKVPEPTIRLARQLYSSALLVTVEI